MTPGMLAVIAVLAFLDAFNPATIISVTLILLAAPRRAGLIAAAVVLGAAATIFAAGTALVLAAGAAADAVAGLVIGLRVVAFAAGGAALVVAGIRRLKSRPRRPIELPGWFSPMTAVPFGILVTGADLPNAFPYFVAIERLIDADVEAAPGLLVILGYTLIYCLPCLVLLAIGLIARRRTRGFLERVTRRFGTGEAKRSIPLAVLLTVLGLVVGSLPFWLL